MTTETTNIIEDMPVDRGVVFYDAACGLCAASARRRHASLARHGFHLVPLQSDEAPRLTGASPEALLAELHLVTPQHRVLRGADALLYIAQVTPWAAPLRWIAGLPGTMPLLRRAYACLARRRYAFSRACALPASPSAAQGRRRGRAPGRGRWPIYPDRLTAEAIARWQPPAIAVMSALVAGATLPPWAYMWTIGFTLYAACKWITWWPNRSRGSWRRSAAYLFAYAGMDAPAFLSGEAPARSAPREYGFATVNAIIGAAALLWLATSRSVTSSHPLLGGWAAMFAIALMIHFGILNLLACFWRARGIAAEPLMRTPIASRSLADFWGRRWNTGFGALARGFIFDPLTRRLGPGGATAAAFLASGLIHDLVISLPAGAGYGRPTLYFLIQFVGLLQERTPALRRLIVRHRPLGRLYAIVFTVAPLPLLFHAPFVDRCILPFLARLGGLL